MIGIYKILNTKNNKVYISAYNSIGEAQRITGIYNISAVCRGQYKSAGGFIWRFTNR